jgi:nucleolar protein 12
MGESKLFSNLKEKKVDKKLESLFSTSSGPVARPVQEESSKKGGSDKEESSSGDEDDEEISEISDNEDFDDEEEDVEKLLESVNDDEPQKKKRKRRQEDDPDVEDRYLQKLSEEVNDQKSKKKKEEKEEDGDDEKASGSESEDEKEEKKKKPEPSIIPNEDEVEKSQRTVFVGNLSNSVITKKADYKALKKLFSQYGKVNSIRFRSVAFSEMLPRKAAFVKHQFHENRDTVNAYIVLEDKTAANKAVELNGTVFMDHHLRVDSVAHPAKHDHKRSIFVGNLDFEATEEPLWKHFGDCGEIEYVRLIRDAKTNVGKGFGYVQFKDSMSISKALLLDGKKLGGPKGRQLRISRAKNIKSTTTKDTFKTKSDKKARLTNEEKTKLGRAKSKLGKAGRSQIDKIIEGTRAKAGDTVPGLKIGGKGKRKNKPRIRPRSTNFKNKAPK